MSDHINFLMPRVTKGPMRLKMKFGKFHAFLNVDIYCIPPNVK